MTTKKHWLHGKIQYSVDVQEEDDCLKCIHWEVCRQCKRDQQRFCENYKFGTSERTICNGCIHRHYRKKWNVGGFPCFKCKFFLSKSQAEKVMFT